MPSPSTTDLPRPTSWDEFENICADLMQRKWDDPYLTRHGRSGQRQDGVDLYGRPTHLGPPSANKYAAAQCKAVDVLTFDMVVTEATRAEGFAPSLSEYVVMTTAPRDAALQRAVRNASWGFDRVELMFWEDISLGLSGYDDLLQKHFPGWMQKKTSKVDVLQLLQSSDPADYDWDQEAGIFTYTKDVSLRIIVDHNADLPFRERWATQFPDGDARRRPVFIEYAQSRVQELLFVSADGGRYLLPIPKSRTELTITPFQYLMGKILNPLPLDLEEGLRRAGIDVNRN